MNFIKAVKNRDLSEYRILVIALAVSLAWHAFCLSAVKIVSAPAPESPVKFSKVAFLGPILAGTPMEVRASPASRGLLEMRYRAAAGKIFYGEAAFTRAQGPEYKGEKGSVREDRTLLTAIDDAVAGKKLEPDYPVE